MKKAPANRAGFNITRQQLSLISSLSNLQSLYTCHGRQTWSVCVYCTCPWVCRCEAINQPAERLQQRKAVLSGMAQDTYQGSYCLIGHDKTQKKREKDGRKGGRSRENYERLKKAVLTHMHTLTETHTHNVNM